MGRIRAENFLFFTKNIEESKFIHFFPYFFQKSSKRWMFLLHQGEGSPGKLSFSAMVGGVSKIALGRGTVFWRVSLWESPSPRPPMGVEHLYEKGGLGQLKFFANCSPFPVYLYSKHKKDRFFTAIHSRGRDTFIEAREARRGGGRKRENAIFPLPHSSFFPSFADRPTFILA